MDKAIEGAEQLHRVKGKPGPKPKVAAIEMPVESAAQAYAQRVWSGQSVDVPPAERIERVCNALKGQNMDIPSMSFLHPDADRYTKASM